MSACKVCGVPNRGIHELRKLAHLRTDGSRQRCQYCEFDAGGGLYASGLNVEDHEPWCPSVLAVRVLGLPRLLPEALGPETSE